MCLKVLYRKSPKQEDLLLLLREESITSALLLEVANNLTRQLIINIVTLFSFAMRTTELTIAISLHMSLLMSAGLMYRGTFSLSQSLTTTLASLWSSLI